MAQAGYNPLEMARFFQKLEEENGSRAPQFLSSHPNPGNRVQAVQAEIGVLPESTYQANTGRFPQMKQAVAQLPPPAKRPEAAQAAAVPAPAPPSQPFKQLQTNSLQLAYPGDWQVYQNRNSNSLMIAPRQGLVQDSAGRVSIGYGAVLSYYTPQSRTLDLEQSTRELVSQLTALDPNLTDAGSRQRRVSVDGNPALLMTLSGASPYGGNETNYLLTVSRPGGLFYMVFVGPSNQFNRLAGTFDQMLQSLRFRRG
jgi:hypothetical protein